MAAKLKGLQKQVEETANRQEISEDNFQCQITELEEEVRRLNIEIKQLKATLGDHISALEEKVEERDSEMVEIEATPALEKELKERSPEMEEVPVTLPGQRMEMEGVGKDVAAIMNTPQRSYAWYYGPYLGQRWEQLMNDSNRSTRRSPKLTHKKFSNIFNYIKSSKIPKLFFYIVSFFI